MVTFVFIYCFFVLGKNAFTELSVLQGFAIAIELELAPVSWLLASVSA